MKKQIRGAMLIICLMFFAFSGCTSEKADNEKPARKTETTQQKADTDATEQEDTEQKQSEYVFESEEIEI